MKKFQPNAYSVHGDVAHIHLPGGRFALVDVVDLPLVLQYRWHCVKGYVRTTTSRAGDAAPQRIFLHRLINNTPPRLHTDHINHDTLDNRRSNLRTVTAAENNLNKQERPARNNKLSIPNIYVYPHPQGPIYYRLEVQRRGQRRIAMFPYTEAGLSQAITQRDVFKSELARLYP